MPDMKKNTSGDYCKIKVSSPEDNNFPAQFIRTFQAFFKPQTMMEVSVATGIYRANICRYVRTMREAGTVAVIGWRLCKVTRHRAGVYTTNAELFPEQSQLSLFEKGGGT